MGIKSMVLLVFGFVVVVILISGTFVVEEVNQAILTRFGKPVGSLVTDPGVHFKWPFIEKANYFEKRYMEWDGDPNEMPTKDKKLIFVDTYARWQITDPLQFFKRLRNEKGAQSRLDDILDGETRNFIANHNLEELVRTSNRSPVQTDTTIGIVDSLGVIQVGREKVQKMILAASNKQTTDLGIVVLDFRIKRINYKEEVRLQVYERMKSERYRIAQKFRSEGQGAASKINGEKERELKTIQSGAFRTAEEIKGRADAAAAATYSKAYNQSSGAKEFYGFLKSMETFENTFDEKSSVVLSTKSELYKYLQGDK